MEEFDLQDIWKESDEQAKSYYQSIEPEVLDMARKKSKGILNKLKRNLIADSSMGIAMWVFFFYYFWDHQYFWLMAGTLLIVTILSSIPAYKFSKKLKAVPTQNVVKSIRGYHEVLSTELRKTKSRMTIVLPIFFIVGLIMGFTGAGRGIIELLQWKILIPTILISILAIIGLRWLTFKFHMFHLYEKPINELKKLLDDLLERD